ncbi:hepatocyte nuclear factor 3-beta [Drosophila montana]|uniref:hepatocyte nuclear factor 3-beta n=1 Tax=Drosophila montana TaxID=40370 RepID=UPI00313EB164
MANTDLTQSRSSSPSQQQDQTPAGARAPSLKPHFVTSIYPLGGTPGSTGCGSTTTTTVPRQTTHPQVTTMALEQYRLQLYNYALNIERLRCPQYAPAAGSAVGSTALPTWLHPYSSHCAGAGNRLATLSTISLFPQSQRIFQPEEPKPQHSYIGLIAMAILSSSEMKLVLSDIYQYILDNYPYFRTRGPGWRNSIRHNLSLNDCFIKSGRSANGKGHYWAIHPANMDDFRKGDFRRRKAQRKVRRHMGLSVDDASTDSPSPPPLDLTTPPPPATQASMQLAALNYPYHQHYIGQFFGRSVVGASTPPCNLPQYTAAATALQRQQIHIQHQQQQQQPEPRLDPSYQLSQHPHQHLHQHLPQSQHQHQHQHQHIAYINSTTTTTIANLYSQTRKRQFDVASLLAPDVQIVDIVEDEDSSTQTQHTVITKVQVKKQQMIHRELVVERKSPSTNPNTVDGDVDADIDVDGDGDGDGDADGDVNDRMLQGQDPGQHQQQQHMSHPLRSQVIQHMLSPDDNNSYLSDARQSIFDADIEEQEPHNFSVSVSVSPPLDSSAASSSQQDSNSLEECPLAEASAPGPLSVSSVSATPAAHTSPLAMTMSLPNAYVELNGVDPQLLSKYYGTYMAAAARRASLEAAQSRAQSKTMTTPPPIELLPNKS